MTLLPPYSTRTANSFPTRRPSDLGSGSMGDVADPATGATKLDLAKSATITALGDFNDDDEVGLWIFTTDLGDEQDQNFLPLIEPSRVGDVRASLRTRIRDLVPLNGTPPYTATEAA